MSQPRIISLCPSSYTPAGHGPIYHLSLGEAVKKNGLLHEAFVGQDWHSPPPNWSLYFKKNGSLLTRFFEFAKLFKQQMSPALFFIESFRLPDYCALVFAAYFFIRKHSQLSILFRYGLPQYYRGGKVHLILFQLLKKKLKHRLKALTDSSSISANFAPHLKIDLVPIPHIDFKFQSRIQTDKLVCWWPGKPREAKGLKEIITLMKTREQISDIQLMVSEELKQEKGHLPLQILKKVLSREEYIQALFKSNVVLLPYDPQVYRYGTSGIFVEAVIAGKIPLVKEGSWLAEELKKFSLEELIVDWENPHFFAHLRELFKNAQIEAKLSRMREAYANFHSVEGFAQQLKYLCTDCSSAENRHR